MRHTRDVTVFFFCEVDDGFELIAQHLSQCKQEVGRPSQIPCTQQREYLDHSKSIYLSNICLHHFFFTTYICWLSLTWQ